MVQIRLSGKERLDLAASLKADIDTFCKEHYDDGPRSHLGASVIGEKCFRKLWYAFRWMHREQFDGRMQRLFNRGHLEEARIIKWLRGIGSKVYDLDDAKNQFRISNVNEHFGGSLDGIAMLPKRYNLPFPFLVEFKTHNEKSFRRLEKVGMIAHKPMHYAQMNTYGSAEIFNFDYGIYFAINKNDDDLYIEVVALDSSAGKLNVEKASKIIYSEKAPSRISASSAYSDCANCAMLGICHKGEAVDKNCRSCKNAVPVENAEWKCNLYAQIIPKEYLPKGCNSWKTLGH